MLTVWPLWGCEAAAALIISSRAQPNGSDRGTDHARTKLALGGLFRVAYVEPKQMDALKSYAYSGVDHSFVSNYIMQPYWSRLVHLFPRWMAYARRLRAR